MTVILYCLACVIFRYGFSCFVLNGVNIYINKQVIKIILIAIIKIKGKIV
jgi:hypothetical protein